jgi:CheY-like chemotaxis protein
MKVLILENDVLAVELLTLRLAQWNCTVLAASTPDEAVAIAEREHPDMVMTELKLAASPLHGTGLIRRLRSSRAIAQLPLIVHSIYAMNASDMPELAEWVDGYLPKPFRLPQLAALMAQHRPPAPTACTVIDVGFNPARATA